MLFKRNKKQAQKDTNETIVKNKANQSSVTSNNIKQLLGVSSDVVLRKICINKTQVFLLFIDGLASQNMISDFILKPLEQSDAFKGVKREKDIIDEIMKGGIYFATVKLIDDIQKAINLLLSGYTLLIFDSQKKAIAFETKGYEKRSITESTEESSFKGSKVTFVEDIRVNTSIMRNQIKSANLTFEEVDAGTQTNTIITLVYMRNICKQSFITKVKERLKSINEDKAIYLTDVSNYIIKHKFTIFPQCQITEKPDSVSASLLEGKVAIIINGIPYSIVMPVVINDFFQAPADYGMNYIVASLFRMIRYTLFFVSIIVPGFYIALTKFHSEMIPGSLAYAIASSKADTPFTITVEVILMIFTFFTLIEASTRIPVAIGGTVSIVGGLVLGEAAITAKLISPGVIVVVAASAIASMAIPNKDMNFATWICSLFVVVFSSLLGLFGLAVSCLILLYHLASLEVLDVPYLAPFAGRNRTQLGDSFIMLPQFLLKFRPYHLDPKNRKRR